jgi:mRNA interferase MazF
VRRGELWLVRSDKDRPAIVLTRDPLADRLNAVLVVAVTSTVRNLPVEVPLDRSDGVRRPAVANLDMTQRMSRDAFLRKIGSVRPSTMDAICDALHYATGC